MRRTILCTVMAICTVMALSVAAALSMSVSTWAQDQTAQSEGLAAETPAAAPEDGGPRRWQVTAAGGVRMHTAPATDAPFVETLAEGAILSNLGCARDGQRVWCNVQPLRGRLRGYVLAGFLQPARGPDGTVPMGFDDSLLRARKGDFDASGEIPCAQIRGEPMGACRVAVARGGGGDATVVVTFANGFKRMLSFVHGEFIRADTTMSGSGFDTDWRLEGGLHFIRVDDQRYELPDALVFGG